jgi:hypothetical protein
MIPFGTLILPGLVLILVASGNFCLLPIFAYAKPMPLDPYHLRNPKRDPAIVTLAGLAANLVLAIASGLALRAGIGGDVGNLVYALPSELHVRPSSCRFPASTGRSPRRRPRGPGGLHEPDHYLVLFILVIFFLLGAARIARSRS